MDARTEKRVLRVFCSLYEAMREDVGQQITAPGRRFEKQEVRTESGGWLLSLHSHSGTNETSKLVPSPACRYRTSEVARSLESFLWHLLHASFKIN